MGLISRYNDWPIQNLYGRTEDMFEATWLEHTLHWYKNASNWFFVPGLWEDAQFTGDLSANTEAAYDAITWNDSFPKPTWATLLEMKQQAHDFYYDIHQRFRDNEAKIADLESRVAALENA